MNPPIEIDGKKAERRSIALRASLATVHCLDQICQQTGKNASQVVSAIVSAYLAGVDLSGVEWGQEYLEIKGVQKDENQQPET